MLTIKDKDVRGGVYVGRELGPDDAIVVPAHIRLIRFPSCLSIKALMTGKGVRAICGPEARIRHLKLGGPTLFKGSLFCGSVDAAEMIVVRGDLVTWLGDVNSQDGSIIVDGQIVSAGGVAARNGAIVAESVKAEGRVFSLNTWTRKSGEKMTGIAFIANEEAAALSA